MYCISISYKKADLDIRKKIKFTEEDCKNISENLLNRGIASECVILSTCNRTEIYYCGGKGMESIIVKSIAEYSGAQEELLSKYLMLYSGDNAVLHLFKVAGGIDSMVIGEDEILGQTKSAYLLAKENNTVSYELNMIFQSAVACAKKIKTETALSKTSVSVATLAANKIAKFGENVNVLVIGASGKIGMTVLKNLVSHKNVNVRATLRGNNTKKLKSIEAMGIDVVDYADRYSYMNDADCVVSATSSPHYTVTLYDLKKYLTDSRERLFIDLAVPPDIDSGVCKLDGVNLINIDYFKTLAKENNAVKLNCISDAERIISSEIDTLKKDMMFHYFLPSFSDVKESLKDRSIEDIIYKMKSEASAELFSEFLTVLKTYKN